MVRDRQRGGACNAREYRGPPQCGLLLRDRLPPDGDPDGAVHTALRLRPDRWLDRPYPGAMERQPAYPTPRAVYGEYGPALCTDRAPEDVVCLERGGGPRIESRAHVGR